MNALINLTRRQIGSDAVETVNARDLHAFLEVGRDFTNWLKDRIEQYGFAENADFVVFANSGENPRGGRPAREYAITLDMAKELAMVERNERGKQARQYFIECERRAKAVAVDPVVALNDPATMRGLLLSYSERVLQLESANAELVPKAEALDRIASARGSLCITDAAKALQVAPRELFQYLHEQHWIFRRQGGAGWLGYSERAKAGLLEHKVTTVAQPDGYERVTEQVRITPAGLAKLARTFNRQLVA